MIRAPFGWSASLSGRRYSAKQGETQRHTHTNITHGEWRLGKVTDNRREGCIEKHLQFPSAHIDGACQVLPTHIFFVLGHRFQT